MKILAVLKDESEDGFDVVFGDVFGLVVARLGMLLLVAFFDLLNNL